MEGFKVGHTDGRVVLVVDAPVVEDEDVGVVAKHLPRCLEQLIANADRSTNRRVGVHEGNTARVGTQVNGTGVALMASNVNHFDGQGQHFRHHLSDGRGGTLADVSSARVDGHTAVHVDLDVNGGVWEILRVPVNGQPGARDEETAPDSDPLSKRHLAEFIVPIRALTNSFECFTHPVGGDTEPADGTAVRRKQVREPQVNGVDVHGLGHFVQPDLNRTSSVDRPVASHGTRGRFVGPHTSACVVEGAEFVRCRRQDAVVVRGDVTEGRKTASVNERIDVKTRDSPLRVGGHLDVDMARVAATVDPVHFFSIERNPNGSAGFTCKNGSAHFVRERVRFSSKAATDKRANDVDLVHGDVENG